MLKHDQAFNADQTLAHWIKELHQQHGIDVWIETGTYKGRTTAYFAQVLHCREVHSTEIDPRYIAEARQYLGTCGICTTVWRGDHAESAGSYGVHLHLGDSPVILESLMPRLAGRKVGVFLDSHWIQPTPTPHELAVITAHGVVPELVVVHDCKVDRRPDLGWDKYPDFEVCLESLRGPLDAAFKGNVKYDFNDHSPENMRGCLVAIRVPAPQEVIP